MSNAYVTRRAIIKWAIFAVMAVMMITFLYPLIYIFINSLKSLNYYYIDKFGFPPLDQIRISNYTFIITQFKIYRYFYNTAIAVIAGGALVLGVSVFASYAFSKLVFKGKKFIYLGVLATMMVPTSVTLIPLYEMFSKAGLVNTRIGLILSYSSLIPVTIFLLTSFFKSIPNEVLDAASIDGAGYFQIVRNVIIPMGRPAILLVVIFNSITIWNDFLMPLILITSPKLMTVTVSLTILASRYLENMNPQYTVQMAGIFLMVAPTVLLYVLVEKYIIKGISVGAIK